MFVYTWIALYARAAACDAYDAIRELFGTLYARFNADAAKDVINAALYTSSWTLLISDIIRAYVAAVAQVVIRYTSNSFDVLERYTALYACCAVRSIFHFAYSYFGAYLSVDVYAFAAANAYVVQYIAYGSSFIKIFRSL